ncbi:MAG: hypothetical protein HQL05_15990 [Nitrospirae bacterium]|nr:hypothetical protein [Nitrospirota bacterium]
MYRKIELYNLLKDKIGEDGTIAIIDAIDDVAEHAKTEMATKVDLMALEGSLKADLIILLPRIIELALNNETDADNTPILIRFINLSADGPKADRFELLSDEQVACISDVLLYIKSHHSDIVECECWSDELNSAINNWHTNHG